MTSKLLMQFHSLLSTGFISSSCSRGVYAIASCRLLTSITEVVHVISLLPLFLCYDFVYWFIYYSFWLCGGLRYCTGFFLVEAGRGPFPAVVLGFLFGRASFATEHGLQSLQPSEAVAPGLWSTDSGVGAPGPSCSATRGSSPDQGGNPCLLHWQLASLSPNDQGSPPCFLFSSLFNPAPLDSC